MDTLQWLTETEFGKCIFTMLVSMVPIIELRGGLPFGVALGLPYHLAFPAAVLGNLIPASHGPGAQAPDRPAQHAGNHHPAVHLCSGNHG